MSHMPYRPTTDYINDNASSIVKGQAVYLVAAGHVDLAKADSSTTATVIGVVFDDAIAPGASGGIATIDGTDVYGSTTQWDAVAGTTGGLTRDAAYYLSDKTAGKLTATPPTAFGSFLVLIGLGVSATALSCAIEDPVGPIGVGTNTGHIVILGDSGAYGSQDTDSLDDQTYSSLITPFVNARITQTIGAGTPFVAEFTVADSNLAPFAAGGSGSGMGVELSLGRALYAAGRTPVKISKWAGRGYSLGVEFLTSSSQYALATAFLDAQVVAYGAIGAMYIELGTNDCTTFATANGYQANMKLLVDALRARYGNFTVVLRTTSPNLDAGYPYGDVVRAQQIAYVAGDNNSILVSAFDLPLASDNLHLKSYVELGYRIATELVARIGPSEPAFAGAFPEYVGAGPGLSGAGTLSPLSYPYGFADGFDVLVVATGLASGAGKATLSEPAGFIEIGSQLSTSAGSDQWLTIFYRRVTSRHMGQPVVADNNNFNAARIFTFRQPTTHAGSPLDIAAKFSKNDAFAANISVTGDTTVTANCLIAIFIAGYSGSLRTIASGPTNAALGSLQIRTFSEYFVGADLENILCITGTKAVAGAVGATTAATNLYLLHASAMLAIKP